MDTVQNEHLHEKHPMGVVSTYGQINPDSGEGTFYISYSTFNALEEDLNDVLSILDEEFKDSESWSYEIVAESGD
ncbi:hypothetical protein [Geomicrobium sp. JCM 19039]|uniref:hypothetical protein n=1 Tax=Geomicrobium sp. JCM 19039 TaxID=1460636 RepID=UPI00045F3841|nr:hypothetical protein [Geomicrobium sp. JCM 19039]GAK13392.1 hypothetical protein JCM19039_3235 [Geomicrobium sp. JCM 19039]